MQRRRGLIVSVLIIGAILITPGRAALAQAGGEVYGYTFLKIGSPGNRPATQQEAPGWGGVPIGKVDHEYYMSKTEVTASDWLEFVKAYSPYYTGSRLDLAFSGFWVFPKSPAAPDPQWSIVAGADRYANDMSWRFAARYANWLNNDKRPERWAFETGAYDTSTFTTNPDGTLNDQIAHSPDAKFWIPTYDEWIKANFYDPNRYGPGQEGYWYRAGSRQEALIPGLPPTGETIAGIRGLLGSDVGQFPDVQSPWGLLDTSGGWREWSETVFGAPGNRIRLEQGSRTGDQLWATNDQIDSYSTSSPFGRAGGLRLASSIPAPGAGGMVLALAGVFLYRRRRHVF